MTSDTALDPASARPSPDALDRGVEAVLARLTLEQKIAQLLGHGATAELEEGAVVDLATASAEEPYESYAADGLGRADRIYGHLPVAPSAGAEHVRALQEWLVAHPPGIPALIQEEILVGLMAYGATAFPSPLAWGASFDADLVETMGRAVGATARRAGVQLGLAPVLDVVVDSRWGRTEECISEDPYLTGLLGAVWTRGVQSQGVIATAKHFAGHSASLGGRNQAPASLGPREFADLHVLPFEMAIRLAGIGSVMHSYAAVDGEPPAGSRRLLTELLRDRLGFDGFVIADYLGVQYLHDRHRVAADYAAAARLAITAGLDMELANHHAYPTLIGAVRAGELDVAVVDTAVRRVLRAKAWAGLIDEQGNGRLDGDVLPDPTTLDLDTEADRALARTVAEESVILLDNTGVLPLPPTGGVLAVVGPLADFGAGLLGDYSFPNHRQDRFDVPPAIELPTVLRRVAEEFGGWQVRHAAGGTWAGSTDAELDEAVAVARDADVVVAVVGDKSAFMTGTVGEGCDVTSLDLPHRQRELLDRLLDVGVPVVVVAVTGRAYALDVTAGRAAAVVQAFFPGQEGASAIAGVLSGRVNPSGRLPVSMPLSADASPYTYRQPAYGRDHRVTVVPSRALWPFGHGLSYTTFRYDDATVSADVLPSDGALDVTVTVRNTGDRAGAEVVQLYAQDLFSSAVRPLTELVGFARVPLAAGGAARVTFTVHADRLSFTGADLRRVVEPGDVVFRLGRSAEDTVAELRVRVTGDVRVVDSSRVLTTPVRVEDLP